MEITDAIILKAAPYSETTLLVTLLTEDRGVVRVLAKGVRRKSGAVQAAFEPFAWVQTQIRQKNPEGLGTIFSTDLREGWAYLRSDVGLLAFAGVGLEVLGGLAAESAPDPALFHEAVAFLTALGTTPTPGSLTIALLLRLLHHAGFPPQIEEPWTAETLPRTLTWNFARGIFSAPRPDETPDPTRPRWHAMNLPGDAVAPLLPYINEVPPLEGAVTLGAHAGGHALRWLIRVWEDHLNGPLKSGRFLEKMVLQDK